MLTRLANSASSRRCRIIASVMSATWNSSRQIRRKRSEMLLPRCSSGSLVPAISASSRCTSRMNSWKCRRVFRCSGSAVKKQSIRKLLPRPTPPQRYTPRGIGGRAISLVSALRAPRLVVGPLVLAALERIERAQLGRIRLIAAFSERLLVELANSHSEVQRSFVDREGRFLGRFREARVGVADAADVFGRRLELHRHDRLA